MDETRRSGDDCATVAEARDRVTAAVDPLERTETLPVGTATGRTLAAPVEARTPLPHYDRAGVDGFALRAVDTDGASGTDPVRLAGHGRVDSGTATTVDPGTATRVDAGDPLPEGADAVLSLAAVASRDGAKAPATDDPVVTSPVDPGAGVERAGAQFGAGETVLAAGRRLRRTDPALCAAVGRTRIEAVQRPTVGIVPTGEGLVGGAPSAGETVETDGRMLSALVGAWGGKVTYRDGVDTTPHALRAAVERDLTKDLLVTTGGTGPGDGDRLYDVVGDLGAVEVGGLALDPGRTAGFAVVRERPVVLLPGDPVACLVAAGELLGPAVSQLAHRPTPTPATTTGVLAEPVESERGVRTVVPVATDAAATDGDDSSDGDADGETPVVRPLATASTASLRSIARADGWVSVAESIAGREAGERVRVDRWEATPGTVTATGNGR